MRRGPLQQLFAWAATVPLLWLGPAVVSLGAILQTLLAVLCWRWLLWVASQASSLITRRRFMGGAASTPPPRGHTPAPPVYLGKGALAPPHRGGWMGEASTSSADMCTAAVPPLDSAATCSPRRLRRTHSSATTTTTTSSSPSSSLTMERLLDLRHARYAQLRAGFVRYHLVGNPQTQPLVLLLHGVTSFSCFWEQVASHLAEQQLSLLTFDFYGHGLSACPHAPYTPQLFADQASQLLDHLHITTPVHLVAHSLGGLVAIHLAAQQPHRVLDLVLINSCGMGALPNLSHLPSLLAYAFRGVYSALRLKPLRLVAGHVGGALLDGIAAYSDTIHHNDIVDLFNRQREANTFVGRLLLSARLLLNMWTYQHAMTARGHVLMTFLELNEPLKDHPDEVAAAGSCRRVLLVWGEDDCVIPSTVMRDFRAILPHTQEVLMKHADHNAPLQRPELLNEILQDFFLGKLQSAVYSTHEVVGPL